MNDKVIEDKGFTVLCSLCEKVSPLKGTFSLFTCPHCSGDKEIALKISPEFRAHRLKFYKRMLSFYKDDKRGYWKEHYADKILELNQSEDNQ